MDDTTVTEQIPTKSVRLAAKDIFQEMAEAGATRNEIIDAIVEATEKSRNYVTMQYNMIADVLGIHPQSGETAPRGKKATAYEIFDKFIEEDMEPAALEAARKQAIEAVLKGTELKKMTAENHLRGYLKTKGYDLARGAGRTRGNLEEKTAKIKAMLDAGKPRADILTMLQTEYGHTETGSSSTYQNIVRTNDWQTGTRSQHRQACWDWFKENLQTDRGMAVKQFISIGASAVMAANYWQTFSLAKELFEDMVEVEEEPAEEAQAEAA